MRDYLTENSYLGTYSAENRRNRDFFQKSRNSNYGSVKRNSMLPHDTEKGSVEVQYCDRKIFETNPREVRYYHRPCIRL
jgi:hypothetical protein